MPLSKIPTRTVHNSPDPLKWACLIYVIIQSLTWLIYSQVFSCLSTSKVMPFFNITSFSISCCPTRTEAAATLIEMLQCFLKYMTKLRCKGLLRIHPSNRHLCTHFSVLAPSIYTPLMCIYILFVPTTDNHLYLGLSHNTTPQIRHIQ